MLARFVRQSLNHESKWSTVLTGNLQASSVVFIPQCNAGSGMKGSTKNRSRGPRKFHRGVRVIEGDYVHPGYLLARMVRIYRWMPGANVVVGRKMRLVAKCSGTVRFTKEVYVPGPETPDAEIAKKMVKGAVMYKTFINVVPERDIGRFKYIESV
uniref:Uncharacterized protein n=1 Tax=Ciona savignyi TaxID=51511 RepID=H2ZPR7_CIOSA